MVIQHRPGHKHGNADGLSRILEEGFCKCYHAGVNLADIPCAGFKYCTRVHESWKCFESDVDDVVPLAIRTVHPADDVDEESASQNKEENEQSTSRLPQYTSAQLQEKQEDPDLGKIITWLENAVTPTTWELYLSSPTVKRFWLNKNLLTMRNKVLYYTWEDYPFSRMLLMVPQLL